MALCYGTFWGYPKMLEAANLMEGLVDIGPWVTLPRGQPEVLEWGLPKDQAGELGTVDKSGLSGL
ncbi:zinc finger protein 44 [Homo sapiens]|uniref:Zinc finger protein 44 n=1 Tax=Homo sapiens TaxID=9606 RepID=E2QRP2_HUMAN|nr:zinc finger protein 44 [Homo sapiens]KAI4040638.1 zinc finger protein 44 [Homo sapiens]